jgi:hypothetical protein
LSRREFDEAVFVVPQWLFWRSLRPSASSAHAESSYSQVVLNTPPLLAPGSSSAMPLAGGIAPRPNISIIALRGAAPCARGT